VSTTNATEIKQTSTILISFHHQNPQEMRKSLAN